MRQVEGKSQFKSISDHSLFAAFRPDIPSISIQVVLN